MTTQNFVEEAKKALATIANGAPTVRCHNLVERLKKKSGLTGIEVELALKDMNKEGLIECELCNGVPVTPVQVKLPLPERLRVKAAWEEAVDRQSFHGSSKRLRAKPIILDGRTHDDVAGAFAEIQKYRSQNLFLRELSSKVFWGQSKVLDDKENLIAELLGVDTCPFLEKPVSLNIHIPSSKTTGILFVENEVSFLSCCNGKIEGVDGLIIVYAAGYKSGTPRIRESESTITFFSSESLRYQRAAYNFNRWLFGKTAGLNLKTYFWGDLDFSGMGILASLRKVFPSIRSWKQGYEPMLSTIEQGGGHTPKESKKQGQKDPGKTGCNYADSVLLPALRNNARFLDQE